MDRLPEEIRREMRQQPLDRIGSELVLCARPLERVTHYHWYHLLLQELHVLTEMEIALPHHGVDISELPPGSQGSIVCLDGTAVHARLELVGKREHLDPVDLQAD